METHGETEDKLKLYRIIIFFANICCYFIHFIFSQRSFFKIGAVWCIIICITICMLLILRKKCINEVDYLYDLYI